MLGEAIQHVKAHRQDQRARADLFEVLTAQIETSSGGAWKAARGNGIDGSEIFLGRQGEALVIARDGRLFRGAIGRGVSIDPSGLRPEYPKLQPLD
ncbi:MAG TPA: hypothetical protein VML55_14760 [Planctomycetaceae bacterium]|nr:hypothetical protein [Planctomycetaceae bacterium]